MAFSVLQAIDEGNIASVASLVSGAYTLTAGSRVQLIVCYAGGSDTTTTMTDTNGNTWAKNGTGHASSSGMYFRPFECKSVSTGGATAITVNWSGAVTQRGMVGLEVAGLNSSASVQVTAQQTQVNPGTATDAITSGTLSPTAQPAMVFGFVQDQGNSDPISAGTGFTQYACPNCSIVNGSSMTKLQQMRIPSTSNTASTATSAFGATHTYASIGIVISETPSVINYGAVGAVTDAASGTPTLALPAGVAANTTLLAFVQMKNVANTAPAPLGSLTWSTAENNGVGCKVFSAVYDGSAAAPTIPTGGAGLLAVILSLNGVELAAPILSTANSIDVSDAHMHYPARTVDQDNCCIVTLCSKNSAFTSVTPAANFTEVLDFPGVISSTGYGIHVQYWIQTARADIPATTLTLVGGTSGATAQGLVLVLRPRIHRSGSLGVG